MFMCVSVLHWTSCNSNCSSASKLGSSCHETTTTTHWFTYVCNLHAEHSCLPFMLRHVYFITSFWHASCCPFLATCISKWPLEPPLTPRAETGDWSHPCRPFATPDGAPPEWRISKSERGPTANERIKVPAKEKKSRVNHAGEDIGLSPDGTV